MGFDNVALPWNAVVVMLWSTMFTLLFRRKASEWAARWEVLHLDEVRRCPAPAVSFTPGS